MQQPAPEPQSKSLSNGSKNYSNNSTLKYSPLRNRSLGAANTRINVRLSCIYGDDWYIFVGMVGVEQGYQLNDW